MDNKIEALLEINNVSYEVFNRTVYYALLNGVFETICKEIKNSGKRTEELIRFRNSKDHILTTKGIVKRYAKCNLNEHDYKYIYTLLRSFFNKKTKRIEIPDAVKKDLLRRQNFKCPYCKGVISLENSHLDHIIPWEYVGDELDNNYQMLCAHCNESKGASPLYEFSMMLYNTLNK